MTTGRTQSEKIERKREQGKSVCVIPGTTKTAA